MRCNLFHWLRPPLFWMVALATLSSEPLARTPLPAQNRVVVQLNWRHQFEFAAFYAAIQQGYYKSAGLDVTLVEGGPGINSVNEVLDGVAHFGVSSSALVLERSQGKPVLALGVFMQHSPIAILGNREKGINSVLDLSGKSLSCSPHACAETKAYLKLLGLDLSTVRFVPHTDANALKRLETVEATEVYWTNDGYRVQNQIDRYILMLPRSAGIDVYGNVLFTTEAIAKKDSDLVQKFREATFAGLRYAQQHPQELVDLIFAQYNPQGKTADHLLWEAQKLNELIRPDLIDPGYMSTARWEHIRDVFASVDALPADYRIRPMLYNPPAPGLPKWFYGLLLGLTAVAAVVFAFLVRVNRLNRQLSKEVALRLDAEARLLKEHESFRAFVAREQGALKQRNLELEHEADLDSLTGLPVRRAFLRGLVQAIAGASRYKRPLAVAILDLDFFKRVNDTYGHPMGDLVLKRFASVLQKHTRAADVAGRWGGEEFIVMFPETDVEGAKVVLEKVLLAIAAETFPAPADNLSITTSAGLAAMTSALCTPEELIATADLALYEAKKSGRNRVCLSPV